MFSALSSVQTMIWTVTFILAAVAGVWVWLRKKKPGGQAAGKENAAAHQAPAARAMGLPVLLRNTARRLKKAKASGSIDAASLREVPVVLVLGPRGAGKSSVLAESRLRPELEATQGCGAEGDASEAWKVWLAERTVFLEVPESAAADANTLKLLGHHLRPAFWALLWRRRQAPRSVLFCAQQSMFTQLPDAQIVEAARSWNSRLCTLCEALGAQVGVYALATNLDGLEGFSDFVSVLGDEEAAQPVGATLPAFDPGSRQVYAEWIDKIVPESFARIVCSLRDSRVAAMSRVPILGSGRESDEADQAGESDVMKLARRKEKLARQYEFPKRFERLQYNLGVFLRELTMTSQVRIEPFLRGYYFCGTRTVIRRVKQTIGYIPAERGGAKTPEAAHGEDSVTATTVLDPKKLMAALVSPATPVAQQEEVREWLFLPTFLRGVLLADQPAHEVSGRNWRADLVRAWAIGAGAAALFLLGLALTVSYGRNRGLERDLLAGGAIVQSNSPANPLVRLEAMRPGVQRLIQYYYDDAPLSMTWGLNQTHRLISPAQSIYCTAVREQVIDPLRKRIEARLGAHKTGAGNPAEDYRLLKAYMMMTTHPAKADPSFLTGTLLEVAGTSGDMGGNPNRSALLSGQLQTYGSLLAIADARQACVFAPSPGLIGSTQESLRGLNVKDRYQSFLQLAGSGLSPVDYNALFPNDAVRDAHVVPGCFTRPGWEKMQGLLHNPEQSLKADTWVLDQREELQPGELKALADQLGERYRTDYIREWKEFLAAGQVSPYANLKDAAAKLEKMSGPRSVLLHLVGLASEHTAFDPVKPVFQPAASVVAANGEFQASKYLEQLDALKNRLLKAADSNGPAHEQDAQEVRGAAAAAQDAVDQIARGFKGDSDELVKAILRRPITEIPGLIGRQDTQGVNLKGKDFCHEAEAVTHALPFARSAQTASFDAVQRLLKPPTGSIWTLYNGVLQDSMTCADSGCFAKEAPKYPLSKGFERYFNALYQWSRLLFGSGGDPVLRLQLQAVTFNYLQKLDVTIDGATVVLPPGSPQRTSLAWDLVHAKKLQVTGTFEGEKTPQNLFQADGTWAIFEWLANAEAGSGGPGGYHWIPRSGTIKAAQLDNMHTKEYKLSIQWADGSGHALDLRSLTLGTCVLPLAR